MSDNKCKYEGKEYSNGARICQQKKVLVCQNGDWKDTGEDCNDEVIYDPCKLSEIFEALPEAEGDTDYVAIENDGESNSLRVFTVFVRKDYIRRRRGAWEVFGCSTHGTACQSILGPCRWKLLPFEDVIEIDRSLRCSGNGLHVWKITFNGS